MNIFSSSTICTIAIWRTNRDNQATAQLPKLEFQFWLKKWMVKLQYNVLKGEDRPGAGLGLKVQNLEWFLGSEIRLTAVLKKK